MVRAAFASRRKVLVNALSRPGGIGLSKEDARAVLHGAGVEDRQRAEELSAEAFLRLTEAIAARTGESDW